MAYFSLVRFCCQIIFQLGTVASSFSGSAKNVESQTLAYFSSLWQLTFTWLGVCVFIHTIPPHTHLFPRCLWAFTYFSRFLWSSTSFLTRRLLSYTLFSPFPLQMPVIIHTYFPICLWSCTSFSPDTCEHQHLFSPDACDHTHLFPNMPVIIHLFSPDAYDYTHLFTQMPVIMHTYFPPDACDHAH